MIVAANYCVSSVSPRP